MATPRLSESSYIVLGMLEHAQPATPYDLKQVAQLSTRYFWTIPHSQLYSECERLAREGLLTEEREHTGRRRRIYRVTEAGLDALNAWRAEPGKTHSEVRDLGILKLFLGADPAMLAHSYLPELEVNLGLYEQMRNAAADGNAPHGPRLALDAGIGHLRESIRFWKRLLEDDAHRARAQDGENRTKKKSKKTGK